MRWRMRRAAVGQGIYKQLARFGEERREVIERVLQAVREQGALGAGSLTTRSERAGPWWAGATRSTLWNGCSPPAR